MRAKYFDDIQIVDIILFNFNNQFIKLEVESIDSEERSVRCKNNWLDFYPNEDDQYIILNQ